MTDATQDRVRLLTACIDLPADLHMGRAPGRDHRARWHILSDEIAQPLCQRATADHSWLEDPFASLPAGARLCRQCHIRFSWRPMPHEYELVDNGYATLCKIWPRGLDGYGYARRGKPEVRPHREAYEQTFGPIPDGFVLHHLCGTKTCLAPTHLEPMSRGDHALLHQADRGPGGRWLGA